MSKTLITFFLTRRVRLKQFWLWCSLVSLAILDRLQMNWKMKFLGVGVPRLFFGRGQEDKIYTHLGTIRNSVLDFVIAFHCKFIPEIAQFLCNSEKWSPNLEMCVQVPRVDGKSQKKILTKGTNIPPFGQSMVWGTKNQISCSNIVGTVKQFP